MNAAISSTDSRAREPGRLAVAATPTRAGDRRHVELVVRRAQAHAPLRVRRLGRLADDGRHLGAVHGPEVVDDPLGVLLPHAEVGEVRPHEMRDDEPTALVDLRALERPREELELRELDRLVDALEHAVDVDARLDELRRQPQRLRRGVRVLEAARVGDERDVERLGDLRRQLDAPARGGCRGRSRPSTTPPGTTRLIFAEPRVVVVVVDVERELHLVEQRRRLPHALRVRAVDSDEHPLGRVVGQLAPQLVERQERVLGRRVGVAAEVHDRVLAERVQRRASCRGSSRARPRRGSRA